MATRFPVDHADAFALLTDLCSEFTSVHSGTQLERELADRLRRELTSRGVSCDIVSVPALVGDLGESQLALTDSDGRFVEVRSQPFAHAEAGDVEARVVYGGRGTESELAAIDAAGAVVLIELASSPPRPQTARRLRQLGAAAMIQMNWGPDDGTHLPEGTVKSVWGNPTRSDLSLIDTLPAVGISRADGVSLRDRLGKGSVTARLRTTSQRRWATVPLPVAWVGEGPDSDRPFVLVGAHYDSWGGAATDNLSGNVTLIAIADALHRAREHLRRDVVFAFWPAHENGIMAGSTWFCDTYWDRLRDRGIAHINVNGIGMRGHSRWVAKASAELRRVVQSADPGLDIQWSRPPKVGDQSFYGVGLPSMVCHSGPDEAELERDHGASLGWWYHSTEDTIDKVDREQFDLGIDRTAHYITALACDRVLPLDLGAIAREVGDELDEIESELAAAGRAGLREQLDWSTVRAAHQAFAAEAADVATLADQLMADSDVEGQGSVGTLDALNEAIRRACQVTTRFRYASVPPWQHDAYADPRSGRVLPELGAIRDWTDAHGDEAYVLYTEARRARNRLVDGLLEAARVLRTAVAAGPVAATRHGALPGGEAP